MIVDEDFNEALSRFFQEALPGDDNACNIDNIRIRIPADGDGYNCYGDLIYWISGHVGIIKDFVVLRQDPNDPKGCAEKILAIHREFASRYLEPMKDLYNQIKDSHENH